MKVIFNKIRGTLGYDNVKDINLIGSYWVVEFKDALKYYIKDEGITEVFTYEE